MWNKIVVFVASGLELHPYPKKHLSGTPVNHKQKNQKETICCI